LQITISQPFLNEFRFVCSIGRAEESIKYRQMFIQVSEDSQDEAAISRACNSLGTQLNALVRNY